MIQNPMTMSTTKVCQTLRPFTSLMSVVTQFLQLGQMTFCLKGWKPVSSRSDTCFTFMAPFLAMALEDLEMRPCRVLGTSRCSVLPLSPVKALLTCPPSPASMSIISIPEAAQNRMSRLKKSFFLLFQVTVIEFGALSLQLGQMKLIEFIKY